MSLSEQNEIEEGIHYSNSFSGGSGIKKGFSTLGPNYRYSGAKKENDLTSVRQQFNDMNIESSATGNKSLDSSPSGIVDTMDSTANVAGPLSRSISKLPSVDETADENYLTTRQERLDSLRKS